MSESDKLQREAERCWLEGIRIVNRGVEQMQRAYALREKAWADEVNNAGACSQSKAGGDA